MSFRNMFFVFGTGPKLRCSWVSGPLACFVNKRAKILVDEKKRKKKTAGAIQKIKYQLPYGKCLLSKVSICYLVLHSPHHDHAWSSAPDS